MPERHNASSPSCENGIPEPAIVQPGGILQGTYRPPGDKSISHRAVILGALAEGVSRFSGFLAAEDCLRTVDFFKALGVPITVDLGRGEIEISGGGLHALKPQEGIREIYLGNSGTSMRLLLGVLAGQPFEMTLTGDVSLSKRPMRRVTVPLKQMGAQIKGPEQENFAPLRVRGGRLKGITFENKLASAQVKSALMLAGLYAEGQTCITEPFASRDHTERFFTAAGADFRRTGDQVVVRKTNRLKPLSLGIPGDISSAAFFLTAAAMTPGSDLRIENVGMNPLRTGILDVLQRMGASITLHVEREMPEPVGTIRVQGSRLRGTRIVRAEIPRLIDELPILVIAMALAEGESLISGAEELRVKETDRIRSMVQNIRAVGGDADELPDGCILRGVPRFQGGAVDSFGDHRTAMSFAVAALHSETPVRISGTGCIATSFPSFFSDLARLRA
ncbi:MAG: 3-phosphoshikimate 1-carboxyvinyltransferase [Candidatus Omnitrophota bacterium]